MAIALNISFNITQERIPEWAGNTMGTMLCILSIISLIGNITVVYVLGKNHRTRRVHLFQINLAICDLLTPLLTYWMTIAGAFTKHWPFGHAGCLYYGFTSAWLALNSITCLTAVSIERYIVISRPFLERRLSIELKIAFALITWIYSFLLAVPPLFGFSQYKLEGYEISCSFDHLSRDRLTRSYIFYLFWGGLILPVCLITFSYAKIYLLVRNSQKFGDDEEPAGTNKQTEMQPILTVPASSHGSTASNKCRLANNNNSSETTNTLIGPVSGESKLFRKTQSHSTNKEIQLTIVIFLAILVFIISWVPYSLMTLTAQFGPRGTISPAVISITSFLAKLSVMYNPFIYWYKDENFKKRSKQLIFCRNGAISS